MISFETLRRVQQKEKDGPISELPPNFFQEARQYLSELDKEDLEYKNAEKVLDEIKEGRLWKILKLAFSETRGTKVDKGNFTDFERETFDSVVAPLSAYLTKVLNRENPKREKPSMRVEFSNSFPKFVGSDGEEYGPFSKGETADVPPENAEILLGRGIVKKK